MTATYHLPKEVVRGVPQISQRLIGKLATEEDILSAKTYKPFERENFHIKPVFDYRSLKIEETMQGMLSKGTVNVDNLPQRIKRELILRGAILHEGLVYFSTEGAKLSVHTGLPIGTKEMGQGFWDLYMNRSSSDVLLVKLERDQEELYKLLSETGERYGIEAVRNYGELEANEVANMFNNIGNIGP